MCISDWCSDVCSSDLGIVAGAAHRLRMNFEAVPVGERENFEQAHGVLLKKIIGGQREAAAVEHEDTQLPRPAAQRRQKAPPAFRHLFVEMGEEGPGPVADALRVEEIELHETVDPALPPPLGETIALPEPALYNQCQPALR